MQSAYDAFQEGNRLLASQNPHAAVIPLERARDLEPDKGSVRETLARAYFRTGRFTQASEEFERTVEIEPVNDYAHFGLGLCLMRRGDHVGARRHLKLAVAMRPDQQDYRAALARGHRRRVTDAAPPVVACDLDGVIWRGDEPIPAAAEGIAKLRAAGLRVAFVSNNSNSPVDRRGRQARPHGRAGDARRRRHERDGGRVAARPVARAGARVLACAGPGVARRSTDGRPGRGRRRARPTRWSWASTASSTTTASSGRPPRCAAGARFVATNMDATYPIPGGLIPGAGALVAAVATAAGRRPEVAGKPEAPTVALVRERFGTTGVVVGDRPSTDGASATALGWPFALVLSGVTAAVAPPGGEAIPEPPPPFVAADLGALAARVGHRAGPVGDVAVPPVRARLRYLSTSMVESVAVPPVRARLRYLSDISCAGDSAPATRRRARAPGVAREPPPGGRGDRGRTRP